MPRLDPPPITRGEQGIPGKGFILSTTEPEVAQDGDIWIDPDTNPGNIYVPGDNEGVVSIDHLSDVNPHNITPALIGLGNVDNTSDADKPVSVAVLAALNLKSNNDHTHSILDLETTGTPSVNTFLRGDGEWALGGSGGGVTDHTLLSNIGTKTHDQLEADIANRPTIADVVASLASKAALNHTHAITDLSVTGTPSGTTYLRGDGVWGSIQTMTQAQAIDSGSALYRLVSGQRLAEAVAANDPKAHSHPISDITALQTALDAKANTSHTHTIANITSLQGTLDGKAPLSHTHGLGDLTATGTKDSTTFLRGDNTWAVPPAGGGGGATDHSQLTGIGVNTHAQIDSHIAATGNPHGVTATHIGLENVNNTSDANKPVSTATQTALDGKANTAHTHGVTDMTATGTRSATTYLRGDNTWATPTNTTYSVATQAEIENPASTTARLISGQRLSQGATVAANTVVSPLRTVAVDVTLDNGSSNLVAGSYAEITIPFAATIANWSIFAPNGSGNAVLTVSRATYANYPTFTAISGTEKPTLSAAQKNQDLALGTWTTAIAAGDRLRFQLDSNATVSRIDISLTLTRS